LEGFLASKSSVTRGRPPVIRLIFQLREVSWQDITSFNQFIQIGNQVSSNRKVITPEFDTFFIKNTDSRVLVLSLLSIITFSLNPVCSSDSSGMSLLQ